MQSDLLFSGWRICGQSVPGPAVRVVPGQRGGEAPRRQRDQGQQGNPHA